MLKWFLIDREKLKNRKYVAFVLVIFLLIVVLAVSKGLRQTPGGDFEVYWQSGLNFFHHHPLYAHQRNLPAYIYPPFAALLFQVFGIFPLRVALAGFYMINFLLFFGLVYLVKRIFVVLRADQKRLGVALTFAGLASFKFFWYNINLGQINEVILALILGGIYYLLLRRETLGLFCLVVGIFLKIMPAFFIIWYLIRNGRLGTYAKAFALGMGGLALPVLWRGPSRGLNDLYAYYTVFLKEFQQGKVITDYPNQNLAAALYRTFRPSVNQENLQYQLFELPEAAVRHLYLAGFLLLFLAFVAVTAYLRFRRLPVSGFELSVVFLTMHLLSGITWKAHLVSLLFVYTAVFLVDRNQLGKGFKALTYLLYAFIAVHAVIGRELIGFTGNYYWGGYNLEFWLLLGLLLYSYYACLKLFPQRNQSPVQTAERTALQG